MKMLIIAGRSKHHKPEDFAPHSDAEAAHAFEYMEEEIFREVYDLMDIAAHL